MDDEQMNKNYPGIRSQRHDDYEPPPASGYPYLIRIHLG
jgi:hypothetical protein